MYYELVWLILAKFEMISTRLRGEGHPKQLLIEFSDAPLPSILDKFFNNCKE
jgi:hypothetical protein